MDRTVTKWMVASLVWMSLAACGCGRTGSPPPRYDANAPIHYNEGSTVAPRAPTGAPIRQPEGSGY